MSSGCINCSILSLSTKDDLVASSVTTVLGVNAVTRILFRRTSCAKDSVSPITPNLDAL